jgi:hypothetical protein
VAKLDRALNAHRIHEIWDGETPWISLLIAADA